MKEFDDLLGRRKFKVKWNSNLEEELKQFKDLEYLQTKETFEMNFVPCNNAISFHSNNYEIVSFYVDDDKKLHIDINPELTPEEAGKESAEVFWKAFGANLKEMHEKNTTSN